MALTFLLCSSCGDEHAVQKSGAMSIHMDDAGQRCSGSGVAPPNSTSTAKVPKWEAEAAARKAKKEAAQQKAQNPPPELQAAFDYSGEQRRTKRSDETADRLDRKIYATGGVRSVQSGGLPTLGRP